MTTVDIDDVRRLLKDRMHFKSYQSGCREIARFLSFSIHEQNPGFDWRAWYAYFGIPQYKRDTAQHARIAKGER